jgi:3-isopropylmalate dehydrogenase
MLRLPWYNRATLFLGGNDMSEWNILLLPGDGIGVEVVEAAVQVLDAIGARYDQHFRFERRLIGGASLDAFGASLTDETLSDALEADAVLLGAVGVPKWEHPDASDRPERGLLRLRKGMEVFANLRPVKVYPSLRDASPLKPQKLEGVDFIVVRELTGGLYFGEPRRREIRNGQEYAVDTLEYYEFEIARVIRVAFELAQQRRRKVASVDKANVLESSRLWRKVALRLAQSYPDVTLEHVLVDTAAMKLISSPASFDVMVTENMFGDILTDEASVLAGSMGMLPSASLGVEFPKPHVRRRGLYEPVHGSAPDIAGKGIANPIGAILSAALMLRYSFGLEKEAQAIERAVERALEDGARTPDLGGALGTQQMTQAILERLQ